MSDESAKPEPLKPVPQPPSRSKYMLRYPTTSSTLVILETDVMRTGVEAKLLELSAARLKLRIDRELQLAEHVKITLSNEIQRLKKETRGVVRSIEKTDAPDEAAKIDETSDTNYLAEIELLVRLTPLEVMLLRMAIRTDDEQPRWI